MKKPSKMKKTKSSSSRTAKEPPLPGLVSVMARLVERMEAIEQKLEAVLGRVAGLPAEFGKMVPSFQRPEAARSPDRGPSPGGADVRRERVMYQAVCADCCKHCEVPFKPTAERPVYCKECFAQRKAGHIPQNPDMRSIGPRPEIKTKYVPSPMDYAPQQSKSFSPPMPVPAKKKQKSAAKIKKTRPKKRK